MKKKTAKPKRQNLHDQLRDARSRRPNKKTSVSTPASHRVTTFKPNGAESQEIAPEKVTIGEAMRRAVEELGDVVINDELAAGQLRQLADAYEQVTREQAAFAKKSEEAKIAKKSLDGATEHLLGLVKEFTHPKPLPLFDADQREADHAEMVEGAQELGL